MFLILVLIFFLAKCKFSKTANSDSLNIEVAVDSNQQLKEQIGNEHLKSPESTKPLINEKSSDVTSFVPEKNEFTTSELNEIEKLRSEAKMSLAANYTALKAFYAEWNRYTTDLKAMGFTPIKSELHFKLGFTKQFQPSEANQNTNEDFSSTKNLSTDTFIGEKEAQSGQIFRYAPGLDSINLDEYSRYCERGCTATDKDFEILLILPLLNSKKVDVWVVNEKKEIIQVLDGTK